MTEREKADLAEANGAFIGLFAGIVAVGAIGVIYYEPVKVTGPAAITVDQFNDCWESKIQGLSSSSEPPLSIVYARSSSGHVTGSQPASMISIETIEDKGMDSERSIKAKIDATEGKISSSPNSGLHEAAMNAHLRSITLASLCLRVPAPL